MALFRKKKEKAPEQNASKEQSAQKEKSSSKEQSAEQGMKQEALEQNASEKSQESKQPEMKEYIRGAGGTIVSKSILNGTSRLKWLFRQDGGLGNGWVAFGDTDTQEYVNNAENMAVVDFNVLANIEPTVVNVFYMPFGADLEFRSDKTGRYFIDTKTGKEIREMVKHPAQLAFEKNLKFLNQESYPTEFFQALFTKNAAIDVIRAGEADFPTGEVVLADPIAYLGTKYETVLEKKIPTGSYPVELSVLRSNLVGLRIAGARLLISDQPAVRYEIAMPKGHQREDLGKPRVFTFFGVDTGLACFADTKASEDSRLFFEQWQKKYPDKNKYTDYFASIFQKSYEDRPEVQNPGGSFCTWQLPETGRRTVLFSSGMGDGIYSGYWGFDAHGNIANLTVPFMNPELF